METKNIKEPAVIEGGIAVDDRGRLTFANDFNFSGVKRFYMVENYSTRTIRAWHGHLKEGKYVFVPQGAAIVAAVEMDDTKLPNKNNKMYRFVLSDRKPFLLFIPPGFANGFRPLEENTKIIFYSTTTLKDSQGDDYRFEADYWGEEVWQAENR